MLMFCLFFCSYFDIVVKWGFTVMVFNTTFNNISVISWWSVLLVVKTVEPGENHRPTASHWQTLLHNDVKWVLTFVSQYVHPHLCANCITTIGLIPASVALPLCFDSYDNNVERDARFIMAAELVDHRIFAYLLQG